MASEPGLALKIGGPANDYPSAVEFLPGGRLKYRLYPREYTKPSHFDPVINDEDLSVTWGKNADDKIEAALWIRGTIMARLIPGDRPGRSRLALKDGPLAIVLTDEDAK